MQVVFHRPVRTNRTSHTPRVAWQTADVVASLARRFVTLRQNRVFYPVVFDGVEFIPIYDEDYSLWGRGEQGTNVIDTLGPRPYGL